MKKKIAIIFTGGTISMKVDPHIKAAVPSLKGADIMSFISNIDELADIEVDNFMSVPSPFVTPETMMTLSIRVREYLSRDDISGVVVTHGTDTLEESAYFLDLTLNSEKPVVVVGAMRSVSELGYDGPSNLAAAIRTVASDDARNKGVLVVMNDDINAADEVIKTHTMTLDTFRSLEFGPLGIVDSNEVLFYRNMAHKTDYIPTTTFNEHVYLVKIVAGMDGKLIDYYMSQGAQGLIIEAFGRGNIPPMMVDSIYRALAADVKVVLVSRCPKGRVSDSYGYEGGSKKLREMGVIFGRNLSGQKARVKLMLALACNNEYNYVRKLFESDYVDY